MEKTQDENTDDIQRQIMQSTLDEVAAREDDAADCCVICLDVITEPCEALPCGHHNFDYICVSNWLFETPRCPLCKAKVLKVVHGPSDAPITTSFDQKPATPPRSAAEPRHYGATARYARRGRFECRGRRFRTFEARPSTVSDVVATRREVYRHQRYSKHVGSNRLSRYRELTPQMFCTDAELVSRARMWIRRELRVFSFLTPQADDNDGSISRAATSGSSGTAVQRRRANNAEFLLEYIIAILKSVDVMGSGGQAEEMLSDFLGRENTKLFLHELRAWLRSPFTKLEDWDRAVQYEEDSGRRVAEVHRDEERGDRDSASRHREDVNRFGPGQKGDFYRPRGRRGAKHGTYREGYGDRSRRRSRSPRRVA